VDENLIQTLGIQLAAGRLFSKEFTTDTARGIILNEEAIAKIGFKSPQEAVGKSVYMGSGGFDNSLEIVGVVKIFISRIFIYRSLLMVSLYGSRPSYNYLLVHTKTNNFASFLKDMTQYGRNSIPPNLLNTIFLMQNFKKITRRRTGSRLL
jgi:putative ABC transport system permease protein